MTRPSSSSSFQSGAGKDLPASTLDERNDSAEIQTLEAQAETSVFVPQRFRPEEFEHRRKQNQERLQYEPMSILFCCFAVGIVGDYYWDLPGIVWFLFALTTAVASWVTLATRADESDSNASVGSNASARPNASVEPNASALSKALVIVLPGFFRTRWPAIWLMFAFGGVGGFWHHAYWNWYSEYEIGRLASSVAKPVCVEGVLRSEPRLLAARPSSNSPFQEKSRTKFRFSVRNVRNGQTWERATGTVDLIVHGGAEGLRFGSNIQVHGQLVRVQPPRNPGQADFSHIYRSQRKLAILHVYSRDSVTVSQLPRGQIDYVLFGGWVSDLRETLNRVIWDCVQEDQAGFASAILLGNREQMPLEERDSFLKNWIGTFVGDFRTARWYFGGRSFLYCFALES